MQITIKTQPKFWILESFKWDLILLVSPGLITIAILPQLLKESQVAASIGALVISGIFDGGHVYTTVWRTWLDPEERKRYQGYYLVPVFTFLIITSWITLRIPYLWSAVSYFTVYHNYRQFYGFTKWYEKLNERRCQFSSLMVQTLCVIPFVLFHFRSGVAIGYMTTSDVLVFPMPQVFHWGIWVYASVVLIWFGFELDLFFRRKIFEPSRILSIFLPAVLYGNGFLLGTNFIDIVYPLLVAHAISYFSVMSLSMQRIHPQKYSFLSALKLVLITAVVFGTIDFYYEYVSVQPESAYQKMDWPVGTAIMIAVLLTPIICHYIFDSWIWRHYHPNAKIVFTAPKTL